VENFLHVVVDGAARYEVLTAGKRLTFSAQTGTTFVLPRGTVDELRWSAPTHRIAVAIHPSLLISALDETAGDDDIELTQHWNLIDPNLMALLTAMATDLDEGSPAGRLYGESLATALAVYLLGRYAVRRRKPRLYRGGLPRYRLKRVLDYIGENLTDEIELAELAALAGMSRHYFCELFKESMGCPPHRFVLLQRIDRAKGNCGKSEARCSGGRHQCRIPEPKPLCQDVSSVRRGHSLKVSVGSWPSISDHRYGPSHVSLSASMTCWRAGGWCVIWFGLANSSPSRDSGLVSVGFEKTASALRRTARPKSKRRAWSSN
jgi:AraC-like DNA-binding protein